MKKVQNAKVASGVATLYLSLIGVEENIINKVKDKKRNSNMKVHNDKVP